MAPVEQRQLSSQGTDRAPRRRRWTFGVIAVGLIAAVGATIADGSHGRKWWSDNLLGPDSSNFFDVDPTTPTGAIAFALPTKK